MKKQKSSSINNLCEVPSSDEETEKARIKLDEELRSCLKIIEDEESQDEDQVTPKRLKIVKRLKDLQRYNQKLSCPR